MQPQAKRDQVNGTTVAFGGLATHISLTRVYNIIKFMPVNLCSIQGVVYKRGFGTITCSTSIKVEDLHQ